MIQEVLENIVKQLVESPEKVTINQQVRDTKTVFTVDVAREDRGKVIGKDGKTIRAIRTLMYALSSDEQQQVIVEVAG